MTSPPPPTVLYTLKYDSACMASKRQESFPSTNSFSISHHTDTNPLHVLQASGATLHNPPRSPCALTISASNIFPKKMSTTLLMCLRPTTKSPQIGPFPCTADSPWTGTTPRVLSTSPCLVTSSVPYKNLVIPSQNVPNTLLTSGLSQSTAQANNSNQPTSPPQNP